MALRLSTGLRNIQLGLATEDVSNGTFETDNTGWTESGNATITGGQTKTTKTCATLASSSGASYAYQTLTVVPYHTYKFSMSYWAGAAAGDCSVKLGTAADDSTYVDSGLLTTEAWTTWTTTVMPTTTTLVVTLGVSAVDTVWYDDVSVQDIAASIKDVFEDGQLLIYSGTQPSSPDAAPNGTLLVTIDAGGGLAVAGDGISFDDPSGGVLSKASAETWSGICEATGVAGWARFIRSDDTGGASTTLPRIDVSVATSGAQINFSSTSFAVGATQTVTALTITLPAN